jgi:HAD superfamily hydrolase (TIGR01549 family)
MKIFEALFFDLGGTLIYFEGDWPDVFAKANKTLSNYLKDTALDIDVDRFMDDFISRLNEYFEQRENEFIEYTTEYFLKTTLSDWGYPQVPNDLIDNALKEMYGVSQSHWHPEKDAHKTLSTLKDQGYRLAIISNASDDNDVQTLVDNANLRPYFEIILSSAAVGIRKPNPRIFEIVLEKMELPNSRVAMVGDTLGADILGAQNADIYSIWITRRADNPANQAHADTIKADMNITTLEELTRRLS